jgi:hypothetical protein
MSFGKLGTAVLTASTDTVIYTVPTNCLYAELDVNVLNPSGSDAAIEVAVATTGTPAAGEYIEKGAIAPSSGGVIQIGGITASPGEKIVVRSAATGTVVRVSGKEVTQV